MVLLITTILPPHRSDTGLNWKPLLINSVYSEPSPTKDIVVGRGGGKKRPHPTYELTVQGQRITSKWPVTIQEVSWHRVERETWPRSYGPEWRTQDQRWKGRGTGIYMGLLYSIPPHFTLFHKVPCREYCPHRQHELRSASKYLTGEENYDLTII